MAQRLGTVCASPSTWYRLVRKHGWRRWRRRVHPSKPKVGVRTTRPDEMWHIDTTVIRPLDGTCAYVHAVIDNFSRWILAWNVSGAFAPGHSVAFLLAATQRVTVSRCPSGVGRRRCRERQRAGRRTGDHGHAAASVGHDGAEVLQLDDRSWWRSLKHHWLFLHALDSVATLRRLVAFYVQDHNLRAGAFGLRRPTAEDMYFGTGDAIPAQLA